MSCKFIWNSVSLVTISVLAVRALRGALVFSHACSFRHAFAGLNVAAGDACPVFFGRENKASGNLNDLKIIVSNSLVVKLGNLLFCCYLFL